MIEYIEIGKLHEHPDNPRKNIGDVGELAESIKKQGLLQNLTVVPHPEKEGEYRIVIGHRRFNAAKRAGLTLLPCAVDKDMDRRAQIAVMMSENMQRNDLTVSERVGGVQMMLDLGLNVKAISEDTGLSLTSVRRYKKIAALGKDVSAAEKQGATLEDLVAIAEIKYGDIREEALEAFGREPVSQYLYRAKCRETEETQRPIMEKALSEFAEKAEDTKFSTHRWEGSLRYMDDDPEGAVKRFKRDPEKKYVFTVKPYGYEIYSEIEKQALEESAKEAKKRDAIRMRSDHEQTIAEAFKFSRRLFVSEGLFARGSEEEQKKFIFYALTFPYYTSAPMCGGALDQAFVRTDKDREPSYTGTLVFTPDDISRMNEKELLHAGVCAAYDRLDQSDGKLIDRYSGKRKEANQIRGILQLYAYLENFGYRKSAEEEAWLNGTHECYTFPHEEAAES